MGHTVKICLNPGISYNEDLQVWEVQCCDMPGRIYTHEKQFNTAAGACALLAKVAVHGEIDTDHWHCRVPYGSDAWDDDGMEVTLMDDEERHHKGM